MATKFDLGETVICTIAVTNTSTGVAADPATSMQVKVDRIEPNYENVLATTAMTDDTGTGAYHYDLQTSSFVAGIYEIEYIATDGTRITRKTDIISLE